MLATCVKMEFSISRFRHAGFRGELKRPCWVGGRFSRLEGRCYLSDALNRLEIVPIVSTPSSRIASGASSETKSGTFSGTAFDGLCDGDHVLVEVGEVSGGALMCLRARRVARPDEGATSSGSQGMRASGTVDEFARFVRTIRDYFVARGLSEIFTPSLVACPGLEPSLEPFSLEVVNGRERKIAYLPTSPEIHLKKALAAGWTDIFEIRSCFRKGEFSPHHENEFMMLEWYRAFADLDLIRDDLQELLKTLATHGFGSGGTRLAETTFAELFELHFQFLLTPQTQARELRDLCSRLDVYCTDNDTFNDLFHRLLIDRLEPRLQAMGPLLIRNFPPSQAALARLTAEGWADRFEFYWQGLEIANAFNEVTDPAEQLARWHLEMQEREHLGTTKLRPDLALVQAMRGGVPPTGGIALGMERLFMACTSVNDIKELKLFGVQQFFEES